MRGFTLLEMMLAVVLFAVGTIAAIELVHRAQAGAADGENILIATQLAQRRLEELRNLSYAALADEARAAVAAPAGFGRFDRDVDVTEPYANLKQIVVTIYWDAPGDANETNLAVQTYRSGI